MKWLLIFLLLICTAASAQTDDPARYIRYPTQYGMRMPRLWADSVFHIPYLDTAQLLLPNGTKAQAGALVCRPQDKQVYRWDGDKWGLLGGGSSANFANSNLTLTGNRVHSFGSYGMRFTSETNFDPGSEYIGFYDGANGLTIAGNSNNPTSAGIRFLDAANPSVNTGVVNFNGTQQWYSMQGPNTGFFHVGPNAVSFGNSNNVRNKMLSSALGVRSKKGFEFIDDIDSAGLFYNSNYKDSGLAIHDDRWIPDAGWVRTRIPDDFYYVTDGATCHDTTFTSPSGYVMKSYELIPVPVQFKGLRVRVDAGILLDESPNDIAGWYYQWIKEAGILRVYSTNTCIEASSGQRRRVMAY